MGQEQCCENTDNHDFQLSYKFQNFGFDDPIESPQGRISLQMKSSLATQTHGPSQNEGEFIQKAPELNSQVINKIQQQFEIQLPGKIRILHGEQHHQYFLFKRTGLVYRGEWNNGKPNGWGQLFYPNGAYYQGSVVDGVPYGFGRLIMKNGQLYIGEIRFGRANGKGQYRTQNGHYKGYFKDNLRHGFGEQKTEDSYFVGTFQYGEKRKGKITFNHDEDFYQGEFEDDLFQGKGKLTTKQGTYNGSFKNGLKQGYGQFRWKDGSYYKGDYSQGQRDGEGEFFNSKNQTRSRGIWKEGSLEGPGQYVQRGKVYRCIWSQGKIATLRN